MILTVRVSKERSEKVPRYVNPETRELWGNLFATTTCFQGLVHDMHAVISKPSTGTSVLSYRPLRRQHLANDSLLLS